MSGNEPEPEEDVVIPVVEERISVEKRAVSEGTVRVTKRVRTEPVRIEAPVEDRELVVERVPADRLVDEAPKPYQDGETWVMPVVEEVIVVQRRLRVREEVRLTWRLTTRTEILETERRIEEVEVERTEGPSPEGDR